jgi:hypothetical protein
MLVVPPPVYEGDEHKCEEVYQTCDLAADEMPIRLPSPWASWAPANALPAMLRVKLIAPRDQVGKLGG